MADRMPEAIQSFNDGKLNPAIAEVKMWQDVLALFAPTSQTATLTAENLAQAAGESTEKKTPEDTGIAP